MIIESDTATSRVQLTRPDRSQARVVMPFAKNRGPAGLPSRAMTYNDDNQIATFNGQTLGYDPDGNMTSSPLTNNTLVTYGYNARNQLTNVGGITYAYDPAGNRVALTNGANVTRFVMDPNVKLSRVLMRVRAGVTTYYIYGAGLLYEISETATTTNTLAYHYDLRGSTIALTDNNGNVTDRVQYSAYGMTLLRGGTNDTPFLYNGRYGVMTDPNGLLYMRARYYNPYLCRFINPDPGGFAGGLNWYCYADGNPISLIDPFGLDAWSVAGNFAEGVAIGAGVGIVVVVAAPVVVSAGAAAIVAGAGAVGVTVSATTATTVAAATVTVGVGATAVIGTSQVAGDMAGSWGQNWNQVAYDAGLLTGGFVVGAAGAGRALGQGISGQPSSLAPSLNPFADTGLGYNPNYAGGSLLTWLASAPTPSSGGAIIGLTSAGVASFIQQSQFSQSSWLTPSTGSSQNQSSSTGK